MKDQLINELKEYESRSKGQRNPAIDKMKGQMDTYFSQMKTDLKINV